MTFYRIAIIAITLAQISGSFCLNCSTALTSEEPGTVSKNGELSAANYTFHPDFYERINETHFRVCICLAKTCIRKCCPMGKGLRLGACLDSTAFFDPKFYNEDFIQLEGNISATIHWIIGSTCGLDLPYGSYFGADISGYYLMQNGTVMLTNTSDPALTFEPERYCMDNYIGAEIIYDTEPFFCVPELNEDFPISYIVGYLLSMPCLVITFLIYAYFPSLRNLHGKCLMSHAVSLFFMALTFYLTKVAFRVIPQHYCLLVALSLAYSSFTAFFWLNAMCFDMWWRFRGLHGRHVIMNSEQRTFIVYSMYSWGVPFLLLSGVVILDKIQGLGEYITLPVFAILVCWFKGDTETLYYFYTPVAILLVMNIFFFASTAYNIYQVRSELQGMGMTATRGGGATVDTRKQQNDDVSLVEESSFIEDADFKFGKTKRMAKAVYEQAPELLQEGVSTYLKLFIVMGVNWFFEFIDQFGWIDHKYLVFNNALNTFQGVFIFIICVLWKPEARSLLANEFRRISLNFPAARKDLSRKIRRTLYIERTDSTDT